MCVLLLACLCTGRGAAQEAAPQEELYLEVTLNGEASGLILRFTRGKTGLRSSVQNLRDLGLDPALFGVAARDEFDLDAVPGLSYQYDAARQSISLRVADALRTPLELAARTVRKTLPATVTPGLVLNYDLFAQLGKDGRQALINEMRYFNQDGVLASTGVWNRDQRQSRYVRFDTYWNHADPDTLESWQLGDLISGSLSWSRSVRMGGLQWRKSFDLRPDLLTFPVATLSGSAVVPSAVSLYINGVREVDAAVPSGPFIINQVAGINGAGQATLVTRDAAGRAVSTTLPLYVDTRMLAAGLSDYSVEVGALRRAYSVRSFSYAPAPAASASLRRGVSDSFTLEAHGEAGRGVVNGGGGALLRLGQAGVASLSLAGSEGKGRGGQASAGYQYLSGGFGIDLQSTRASARYSDLGTAEGSAVARASDRATLNFALFGGQSLGLSYVALRTAQVAPARIVSASYAVGLGGGVYFSLSAFRDLKEGSTRGLFASLSVSLGDRISANAASGRQSGVRTRSVNLSRAPDLGGGFGWGLQSTSNNGSPLRQAQVQYLGGYGQLGAFMQENGNNRSTSLDLSGALVLMDGTLQPARQVGAGFALVSTGTAGVPVLQENRPIGLTDGRGYLLVPNLNPYISNQVGIDVTALPLDARVAVSRMEVVPSRLSGVLARFPVEKYAAATVLLLDGAGKPVAPGTLVLHAESGASTVVGFDGMAFIDRLQPLNHLLVGAADGPRCAVEFAYRAVPGQALPVLGPFTCRSVQ